MPGLMNGLTWIVCVNHTDIVGKIKIDRAKSVRRKICEWLINEHGWDPERYRWTRAESKVQVVTMDHFRPNHEMRFYLCYMVFSSEKVFETKRITAFAGPITFRKRVPRTIQRFEKRWLGGR